MARYCMLTQKTLEQLLYTFICTLGSNSHNSGDSIHSKLLLLFVHASSK